MKLKEALDRKKFVVTSEIQSPAGNDPQELIRTLNLVRGRVDSIAVTETETDVEGIVGDSIRTCDILQKNRFEAIYQTTTRDKNRIQLQKDLIAAHEAGIGNVLVFTEDYRISGESLQEMMFFHVDAGKLQSVLELTRKGVSVDGRDLSARADFIIGSGVDALWGRDFPDAGMRELEQMTRMGTGYFLTTPVFDLEKFEKFMKQMNSFSVPVIAEIMILKNAGMAKFINRHLKTGLVPEWMIQKLLAAPDKQTASLDIFTELANGLQTLCQGVHIITMGMDDRLPLYLNAARLK